MPPRVRRLDVELTRRGLARSREQAASLIAAGRVEVRGVIAHKPATGIAPETPLRVLSDAADPDYASRGGVKLAGALAAFAAASAPAGGPAAEPAAGEPAVAAASGPAASGPAASDRAAGGAAGGIRVAGRRCLDAGASTGGFTDVLLRQGAREVVAVDVGYGQLDWALRSDPRVVVRDRTNVRTLTPDDIGGPVELCVADLSFISLRLVLPALDACTEATGDLVPMVKPQFEVGRERLGSGGVVRDPALRADAVLGVVAAAAALGRAAVGLCASPLPGPSGNVEFFLWLRRDVAPSIDADAVHEIVRAASGKDLR